MVDSTSRRLAGRYELRGLIGRGGMAEVRLGYDTRLSRVVAVKMLRTDLARDSIFQERFRREAQSAASLNHPAIVAVYDTGEESMVTPDGSTVSVPYIVMEYVEGHTVRDLLQTGEPVRIDEAVEIVAGVLSALEYSHHEGLVHRDIKPGNIMLTNTGKVKVMDFGIARALTDSQATMTQTDAVVGTAQYLSPEQAQGQHVDARSDLYSTGCVLFELLTGRPPFKGDSAVAVAYQHVSEVPPTPSSIASDIPASLDRVVLRSLAKRPDDRYSSAAEMRADLMRAARGGHIDPVPETAFISMRKAEPANPTQSLPPMPPAPTQTYAPATSPEFVETEEPRSRSWIGWLLVALALIVVAVAVVVMTGRNSAPEPAPATPQTVESTVSVPDLTGKTQDEAAKALQNLGLKIVVDPQPQDSDTVPENSIVSTNPAAGANVTAGDTVTVFLSKGPKQLQLPNVAGQTDTDATEQLKKLGITASVQTVDDPQVAKGRVVGTEPAAGTNVKSGDSVKLLVASGYVSLPTDLVGKTQAAATEQLQKLGLSVSTTTQVSEDAKPGTVIEVNPVGSVQIRSEVKLTIAKAAPKAPVKEAPAKPAKTAEKP